jgi:dTDP-4-dehydrorhamnose reductase
MTNLSMLVTGGSGHLGGWVVHLTRAEWACPESTPSSSKGLLDWNVTATYLTRPGRAPGVDWRSLDVRDQAAVEALVRDVWPRVIVHTAALNPGQGTAFDAVNADGTRHVARAAALVGARLIHVSTDVVFDGQKGGYVEEDRPSPLTSYGRSKALAEEAVWASEARALIVRTSLIYGPAVKAHRTSLRDTPWQQWDRQTRWVVGDLKAGKPVRLFTDERRCPIWVESLAAALLELARSDAAHSLSTSRVSPRGSSDSRLGPGSGAYPELRRRDPGRAESGLPSLPASVLHVAGAQPLSRYQFGLRLARFHGVDPAGITPALSRDSGLTRPLDCSLDCSRARSLLHTPLPGVDRVLECAGRGLSF